MLRSEIRWINIVAINQNDRVTVSRADGGGEAAADATANNYDVGSLPIILMFGGAYCSVRFSRSVHVS
jgi:hypothetical protein